MHLTNKEHLDLFNGIDFRNVVYVYMPVCDITLDRLSKSLGLSKQTICEWKTNPTKITKCQVISLLLYIIHMNDKSSSRIKENYDALYKALYEENHPDRKFTSFKDILNELMLFTED